MINKPIKKIALVSCMLVFFIPAIAQYTVTKVIGNVKIKKSGEILTTGSKFTEPGTLAFPSGRFLIRAIVTGKGVVVIDSDSMPAIKTNTAVDILKYAFHVRSREGYLSGRGATDELLPDALMVDTSLNANLLVEKENKYLFDRTTYQVANGDRFFIQEKSAGPGATVIPLKTAGDTLFVLQADFPASPITRKKAVYTLAFYSKEKDNSESLLDFVPYFDRHHEMETIINAMVKESRETDHDELQHLCYREVYESLGKPPMILFRDAFDRISARR